MQGEDTPMEAALGPGTEGPSAPHAHGGVDLDIDDIGDMEDELEDEDDLHWVLGFPEPALQACDMLRHAFPSKVGGRPAWLDPLRLPSPEDLRCPTDGSTMRFLLQVYAPVEEQPEACHRTMFVFVSGKASALHGSSTSGGAARGSPGVQVYRCQLPRSNEYYVYNPLTDRERLAGPRYCGEASVADPWAVAAHEKVILQGIQATQESQTHVPLFPEYEIVIEEECEGNEARMVSTQELIQENMQKATDISKSNNYTEEELPSELIDEIEKNMPLEKRHFASFAARIAGAPSQILRYCFEDGSGPICPSPHGIPTPDQIPPCEYCGASRKFEFQILPQVLNILGVDPADDDALDFGTIAVYSCSRSCSGQGYKREFAWVQKQ
jgi:pre-rRNA-processing protein TSR4